MREVIFSARRSDFRIDTFCSGGPGGQHQNKTQSGVRVTHIATGITAECREHRHQLRNKVTAFRKVCALLVAHVKREEAKREIAAETDRIVRHYHGVRNVVKDVRTGAERPYQRTLDGDLDPFMDHVE